MNASAEECLGTKNCAIERPRFWDNLMHDIHRRKVVPILGKDLLEMGEDGQSMPFERFLAEKLAESCGSSLDNDQSMRHALAIYKESEKDLQHLRPLIKEILRDYQLPIPKSLLQLASIEGFTLYVTTTFDSLLHQALIIKKRWTADKLLVRAFDPTRGTSLERKGEVKGQWDLSDDFDLTKQETPIVYHLFGMDCPDPDGNDREDFAMTEEELLEYLVSAQQPNRQPRNLFETLRRSRLLLLGTSYPDWLARFFLRLATAHRIFDQRKARQLWVDWKCNAHCELAAFLQDYSTETDICFSKNPVSFVDQLYEKWQEYKSKLASEGRTVAPILVASASREEKKGKIFISYASEDRTVMETFAGALEKAGLDIWWDKSIEAARKWDEVIAQQIEEACVFVALLSRHTIDPDISTVASLRPSDRFFRREWRAAFEKNEGYFGREQQFIIPVYIDDVDRNSPGIRIFADAKFQGVEAPGGNPSASLLERLRTLQRNYRRSPPR